MSDRKWHKGPPPHVGWWNASRMKDRCTWRWWNGNVWSWPVEPDSPKEVVKRMAACKADDQGDIEWSDYYPTNARVPRIDPRKQP